MFADERSLWMIFRCFVVCICFTNIPALRPYLRVVDVALREMEARHTTIKHMLNVLQQPHVQRKVQHNGAIVLAATNNHVQ